MKDELEKDVEETKWKFTETDMKITRTQEDLKRRRENEH